MIEMMISPEAYYEFQLKGKDAAAIKTAIRSLKRDISRLKNVMEHPDYQPTIMPKEDTRIWCDRLNLERAKEALRELGEEYTPTKAEFKALQFDESIPEISSISLEIGGYFSGYQIYKLTVAENAIQRSVEGMLHHPIDEQTGQSNLGDLEDLSVEDFREALADLHIGEWRKRYDTERFGFGVLDGTQWELKIEYNGARKTLEFFGSNAYPYNFEQVKDLFGVDSSFF